MELCRTDGGQELKESFESSNRTALKEDTGDRYFNFLKDTSSKFQSRYTSEVADLADLAPLHVMYYPHPPP